MDYRMLYENLVAEAEENGLGGEFVDWGISISKWRADPVAIALYGWLLENDLLQLRRPGACGARIAEVGALDPRGARAPGRPQARPHGGQGRGRIASIEQVHREVGQAARHPRDRVLLCVQLAWRAPENS